MIETLKLLYTKLKEVVSLKLIGLYAIKANNLKNKLIIFDNNYKFNIRHEQIKIIIDINKIEGIYDTFDHVTDKLSIKVLLGVNGTGKTTILEILNFNIKHNFLLFYVNNNDELYIEGNFNNGEEYDLIINETNCHSIKSRRKTFFSISEDTNFDFFDFHEKLSERNIIIDNYNLNSNKYKDKFINGGSYYIRRNNLTIHNELNNALFFFENYEEIIKASDAYKDLKYKLEFNTIDKTEIRNEKSEFDYEDKIKEIVEKFELPIKYLSIFHEDITADIDRITNYVRLFTMYSCLQYFIPTEHEQSNKKFLNISKKAQEHSLIDDYNVYLLDKIEEELGVGYKGDYYKFFINCLENDKDENVIYENGTFELLIDSNSYFVKEMIKRKYDYKENVKSIQDEKTKLRYTLGDDSLEIKWNIIKSAFFLSTFKTIPRQLSSGEQSFLKLTISLLRSILNDDLYSELKIQDIYVLLDEPDAFFHPELCRKFINYLANIYSNVICKYNIIMTTHSEHTLSDIPHSNIISMSQDILCPGNNDKKTFAKNIGDIALDNMILESNIGEYAKNIIEKLLDDNQYLIQFPVEIIGDNFLRNAIIKLRNKINKDS